MQKRQATANDLRLRRLAIQIAAQLPEETGDAETVLNMVRYLVRNFMEPVSLPGPDIRLVSVGGAD